MTEQHSIDLDEESKKDEKSKLNDESEVREEAKRLGIDYRKYDIEYLVRNSPFKTFNPKEVHDWSRYRIFSLI